MVRKLALFVCLVMAAMCVPRAARAERVRDLADVSGARENQLIGFGLVTGLQGTGDDITVPFTSQSILSMLRRLGVQSNSQMVILRNVAAVVVTANIPAFEKPGGRIDVTVSSIGNARSLSGGVLVQTLLKGADQNTYAVAQGALTVGGFEAHGASGSSVRQGSLTTARVPNGAIVEREIPVQIAAGNMVRLELRTPGFTIAARIAQGVNEKLGAGSASAPDGGAVVVRVPNEYRGRVVELVALLEEIEVTPVRRARVVVNERSGTIVAGGDVRLAPVAIVHGGLTIVVKETQAVSQPGAFSNGTSIVTQQSDVSASEDRNVAYLPAAPTLADVATALGTLGLSPRELTSVLEALRAAGALEAELVVQ